MPFVQRQMGAFFHIALRMRNDYPDIAKRFLASRIPELIAEGNPKYVAGTSGADWYLQLLDEDGIIYDIEEFRYVAVEADDAYWVGWVIAYYQWLRDISFAKIFCIPLNILLDAYYPLHEADITKAVEFIDAMLLKYATQ